MQSVGFVEGARCFFSRLVLIFPAAVCRLKNTAAFGRRQGVLLEVGLDTLGGDNGKIFRVYLNENLAYPVLRILHLFRCRRVPCHVYIAPT